jgi:hypothetical protein
MKKYFYLILIMIPLGIFAQTPVQPGPVSGTWDLAGSPYMINGEIYIEPQSSLTIEPGVEVRFTDWYKLNVYGSLMAEGSETDSILFTADNSNIEWHGIRFIETEQTSVLDYCIVEYGLTVMDEQSIPDNCGGGILCYLSPDASITIKNSTIRNNQAWFGGGIDCYNASPVIENCQIVDNHALKGGAIELFSFADPVINNSLLAYNYASIDGGAISCNDDCSPVLTANSIIHNSSAVHGGGIDITYTDGLVAKRNLIANNSSNYGGGIALFNAPSAEFKNNTIVFNQASVKGGGLYVYTGCCPGFTSDIIYYNQLNGINEQVFLGHATTIPSFQYCNIMDSTAGLTGVGGGIYFTGTFENCIDEDPLFTNALTGDYTLSWNNYPHPDNTMSPCIDAGCPGLPEPDGTPCDIGCYSFFQQLDVPVALPPDSMTYNSFYAFWTCAYGALGYHLDVALDEGFTNMVYEGIEIEEDTSYLIEGLDDEQLYYYRVMSFNSTLTSVYSNTQTALTNPQSVDEQSITDHVSIYPNPFINSTTFSFNLPRPLNASVMIYNIQGQLIERFEQEFAPGENQIQWNATTLPNGVYHFILTDGDKVYSEKRVVRSK